MAGCTGEIYQQFTALNLSDDELDRYKKKFQTFDLNKDGLLTIREIAAVGRVFGYRLSKEEICEMFGRGSLDVSTGIGFEEFVVAMHERARVKRAQGEQYAPYREAFRLFDPQNRGYITSEMAYPVLRQQLGFDLNKTEEFLDMFDRNQDYRLSLLEFVPFYDRVKELIVQVETTFREFDKNGDGLVDKAELKDALVPQGFAQAEVDNIVCKFDRDQDGMLNYPEFAEFWNIPIH